MSNIQAPHRFSRRRFLAVSAAVSATILLDSRPVAAADVRKTFTILHTNDLHSNFIGMSPESDYTPFTLNDDKTLGGFARLAPLIAARKAARQAQGPVLVLDDGDYSNGTAFGAATRETGAELQLLFRMGFDATTFGNHEFDFGPDGLGTSIAVAAKAGRTPPIVVSNIDLSKADPTLVDLQRLTKEGVLRRHLVIERGGLRFGHLSQPRRLASGEGRAIHRRRRREPRQSCAGHRRRHQRAQSYRGAYVQMVGRYTQK